MHHLLVACAACLSLLMAARVSAATYPAAELGVIANHIIPNAHPFLLTNGTQVTALIKAAKAHPTGSEAMELKRLSTEVASWVADPAFIAQKTDTYNGTDLRQYENRFSVISGVNGGAALYALIFAYYHLVYVLDPAFGDEATDTAAANDARAIIWNWSQSGFRPGGKLFSGYDQFTGTDPDGSAAPLPDVWSGVNLQIGRGMLPLVVAQDIMQATTPPSRNAAIDKFLVDMRDMLIGAANDHYAASPDMDCHRYDNQAATGLADLLALAWYTGDADLIDSLAGVPGHVRLLWSWPQQVEAQIYGSGEGARTCNEPTTATDKYNPIAVLGEITDRERNEQYQPFGYPTGSMESLMQAAHMFRDLGFDAYHFTGPHGQNIQAALNYYSQYYTSYAALGLFYIPATGTISDFGQYAGDVYTTSTPGAAVMGGDGLIWPYLIGRSIFPNDTKIMAAMNKAEALYEHEMTVTKGKVSYLPASDPDIMSLVMQESAGD